MYFEHISNRIIDKTNVENEIISKEVDISSEMVKQDARKIHFQVKINGEDINKSKDIVSMKTLSIVVFLIR